MYTYYRVRRLRTEERLAAIARGANVAMEPDLSEAPIPAAGEFS